MPCTCSLRLYRFVGSAHLTHFLQATPPFAISDALSFWRERLITDGGNAEFKDIAVSYVYIACFVSVTTLDYGWCDLQLQRECEQICGFNTVLCTLLHAEFLRFLLLVRRCMVLFSADLVRRV